MCMLPPATRPPAAERCFSSPAVESALQSVGAGIGCVVLRRVFENALPATLDRAIQFSEGSRPLTFVPTGDIPAMWLRDSTQQVWPYLRWLQHDAALARMVAGVIHQQVDFLRIDPYANAFEASEGGSRWAGDHTAMHPRVHERKWELDSPAAVMRLSHAWWRSTQGSTQPFDPAWREAMASVLVLLRQEQGAAEGSRYRFQRTTRNPLDSLPMDGAGPPGAPNGLVRSCFRPSDDACTLPYHVPSNFLLRVALDELAILAEALGERALSDDARRLSGEIAAALDQLPVPWPYEVDGHGSVLMMDDANVPSLLSLPWLGAVSRQDPRWQATRRSILSVVGNPYFVQGGALRGIGSPHTGRRAIWPLALILQALTSDDDDEIASCLQALLASALRTGLMHESFDADAPLRHTRPWFAWANAMFAELVLVLHDTRPALLQGFRAVSSQLGQVPEPAASVG